MNLIKQSVDIWRQFLQLETNAFDRDHWSLFFTIWLANRKSFTTGIHAHGADRWPAVLRRQHLTIKRSGIASSGSSFGPESTDFTSKVMEFRLFLFVQLICISLASTAAAKCKKKESPVIDPVHEPYHFMPPFASPEPPFHDTGEWLNSI